MAYRNVVDDSSTTVSASTPGWTVDLTNHTTHRLRSVGVPVRFKVCVNSTVGGDTGAVKLVDSSGTTVLTCLINNPAATSSTIGDWYWVDGYVPATLAKYDVHYGGNTLGTLTPLSASLYEIDWTTDPITGSASMTLGALTVSAYVPFSGDLSATLGALTVSSTGAVEVTGASSTTLDAMTVSGTGTVATPASPPTYQAIGAVSAAAGDRSPAWPAHAVDDIAILLVMQSIPDATAPAVPTLSPANGFARGALPTEVREVASESLRVTAWYCRATSTSMSAPTVLLGDAGTQSTVIITFRGCTTSGDPTDVSSTASNTGTSISIGANTTTGPALVCAFAAAYTAGSSFSSWANAALTSFTERLDDGTVGTISAATGTIASAATYGTATATYDGSSTKWAGFQFALKP